MLSGLLKRPLLPTVTAGFLSVCATFGNALAQGGTASSAQAAAEQPQRLCNASEGAKPADHTLLIAVASNFALPMQKLAGAFEADTGCRLKISKGSTGSIYGQIKNGAPYEVFFAADQETPTRLAAEGLAVEGSIKTYAVGKLALWRRSAEGPEVSAALLESATYSRVALANPDLAPYGRAAVETLSALKLLTTLQPKLVYGENIGQTFQFAATGNADLAFVALSQIMVDGKLSRGATWVVPQDLYQPIRQDAVVLNKASQPNKQSIAQALLKFMDSNTAIAILESYGYQH